MSWLEIGLTAALVLSLAVNILFIFVIDTIARAVCFWR